MLPRRLCVSQGGAAPQCIRGASRSTPRTGPRSQIVLEPETCPNLDEFKKHGAGYGACIEVVGTVVKSPGRGQLIEMKGSGVRR